MLESTKLVLIEPGFKINGANYREVLFNQHLLPAICSISKHFTLQHDNAPAHRANETVEFLSRNTPDYIAPWLWPPNSPDLNPVDYEVWGVPQERVYRTQIRDVDHLKQRLIEKWCHFDQRIIDRAVHHGVFDCVSVFEQKEATLSTNIVLRDFPMLES